MNTQLSEILPETELFASKFEPAKNIAKVPKFFNRTFDDINHPSEIRILRRWNSHTPSLSEVLGGGYFIYWKNRGTIIDPGCSFIRTFQGLTNYNFNNINMIITTHDHIDHCQDFGTLISLLRQYNSWNPDSGAKLISSYTKPHILDLIITHGVSAHFSSFLNNPENTRYLRCIKVLPHSIIDEFPASTHTTSKKNLKGLDKQKLEDKYGFKLLTLPVKHKELLGENTGIGLKFEFSGKTKCPIVISGDTGVNDPNKQYDKLEKTITAESLANLYSDVDLLILHVGTMETLENSKCLKRESSHLGMMGVVEILYELSKIRLPKVVVLTEWGYEFGRLGLHGRTEFTKLVVKELERPGRNCNDYFAAVPGIKKEGTIPIIPADVGLRLSLPDLKVYCTSNDGKEVWVEPTEVMAEEYCPEIIYRPEKY